MYYNFSLTKKFKFSSTNSLESIEIHLFILLEKSRPLVDIKVSPGERNSATP